MVVKGESTNRMAFEKEFLPFRNKARKIVRECYICGGKLYFINFINPLSIRKMKVLTEDYGFELLYEIWTNPIFVLECCWCLAGVPRPNWGED